MTRPVFLSSVFEDPRGTPLPIRERVKQRFPKEIVGSETSRPVWIAEDFHALDPGSPVPPFEKVQLCLDGVREAECFVAVITNRHGSMVPVDTVGEIPTSFFEAELFEAALLGKPSFVLVLKGYTPEPRLEGLLDLLQPAFPGLNRIPVSEDDVFRLIEKLVRHYERPRWLRPIMMPPALRGLVRTLARRRHRPYDVRSEIPTLRFLSGLYRDPAIPSPDPRKAELLIESAARKEMTQQARLTTLWFAIRELMGGPFTDPRFVDLVPLWDRALSAWTSAGAWYGLHAHLELGCLASLGSVCEVRQLTGQPHLPHGPLASEYYSIAKLARSRQMFELALRHVDEAIESSAPNESNALAIRGSIYRQLGEPGAAIADYETVAARRRNEGGPAYGEALSELGFGLVRNWKMKQGIAYMERGLDLLNQAPPDGFTLRAMRKLALGYAQAGSIARAVDLASATYELATKIRAYDQIGRLERLSHALDRWRR